MTTQVEPSTFREWRINRVRATLVEVAAECADPRLVRRRAEALAAKLHEASLVVADLYICPICGHPEVRTCVECPLGGETASAAPDLPTT
jgi:rubrerythrin